MPLPEPPVPTLSDTERRVLERIADGGVTLHSRALPPRLRTRFLNMRWIMQGRVKVAVYTVAGWIITDVGRAMLNSVTLGETFK